VEAPAPSPAPAKNASLKKAGGNNGKDKDKKRDSNEAPADEVRIRVVVCRTGSFGVHLVICPARPLVMYAAPGPCVMTCRWYIPITKPSSSPAPLSPPSGAWLAW
jgi:hypothetical protein